uniref:hypothetical protein n=1 Tax=Pedobacter schmidteae TaxID=2201271 RepID=UPI000EB48558|nr:hypothetical protein [Pedobacter schmidteae]
MARMDGKFIRGVAGDLIFRKIKDKQVIQGKTKKKQINMTAATYNAAYVFGRASTLASHIRIEIDPIIGFYDGGMIPRFTGECNLIVQQAVTAEQNVYDYTQAHFNRLNGFEFNIESPVKNYLFAQPIVTLTEQTVTIDLPEIKIPKELKFPEKAKYCTVAFSVSLFDLGADQCFSNEIKSFEIEWKPKAFNVPAQQLVFEGSPGCLCIIALGLFYSERTFAGKAVLNNKELNPSAILKADFCPGQTVPKNGWREITYNDKKKRKKVKEENKGA